MLKIFDRVPQIVREALSPEIMVVIGVALDFTFFILGFPLLVILSLSIGLGPLFAFMGALVVATVAYNILARLNDESLFAVTKSLKDLVEEKPTAQPPHSGLK